VGILLRCMAFVKQRSMAFVKQRLQLAYDKQVVLLMRSWRHSTGVLFIHGLGLYHFFRLNTVAMLSVGDRIRWSSCAAH
jgi:hypothetical protein